MVETMMNSADEGVNVRVTIKQGLYSNGIEGIKFPDVVNAA